MKRWTLLPLALLMLLPANIAAQEADSGPTWWAVFSENVESNNIAEFEAVSAEFRAMVDGHTPDGMVYYVLSGAEDGYMYAVPMESLDEFAEIGAKWQSMVEDIGRDTYDEVDARSAALVTHRSMNFYVERPDLSYMPEALEAASGEMSFRHFDWLYVEPGSEAEFAAILKEWVELYEEYGIESGWSANQAVTGDNLPMWVLITPADGMAAWANENDAIDAVLGDADDDLLQRSLALMRAYNPSNATFRPELSVLPEND